MTTTRFPRVFDGHNDILTRLYFTGADPARFLERQSKTHLDLPRMLDGGFGGGFFAIMPRGSRRRPKTSSSPMATMGEGDSWAVPLAPPVDHRAAQRQAVAVGAFLFKLESGSGGQFRVVRDVNQLRECLSDGAVGAVLHFEGAEAIDRDLKSLEFFYAAGLRSLGLVWSRPNTFATGVPFRFPHTPDVGPGLTAAGKRLVQECNRLGIMVDLSHLNERGFWDVAETSDAPLVASHSNAHALSQVTRNLTDKQLDAVKESNGIVGVNFAVTMLREDGRREPDEGVSEIVRHIDYMVERMGIDSVGIGSDFDGTSIPAEIGDVSGLPNLMQALADRGYDEASLKKIAHENWVRVLEATWR
jgi:membrane dipeptidase